MNTVISVVDDDKAVRDALRRMLNSYGFSTEVFSSAEEFLDSAVSGLTSCLVLDIRMPGMSGLALHDHLIGLGRRIPTILITACPTSAEQRRALASGAISYLAKPFDEQLLLETVREAIEQPLPDSDAAPGLAPTHAAP